MAGGNWIEKLAQKWITDWINMCEMVHEITFTQINGDFSIRGAFLENPVMFFIFKIQDKKQEI